MHCATRHSQAVGGPPCGFSFGAGVAVCDKSRKSFGGYPVSYGYVAEVYGVRRNRDLNRKTLALGCEIH